MKKSGVGSITYLAIGGIIFLLLLTNKNFYHFVYSGYIITNEKFFNDLADGIESRLDADNDYDGVMNENSIIGKYGNNIGYIFDDENIEDFYDHYFSALNMEINSFNGSTNKSWDTYKVGESAIKSYLKELDKQYNFSGYISKKYKDAYHEYVYSN